MLLRTVILLLLLALPLQAAYLDLPLHKEALFRKDIVLLQSIVKRKPNDLKSLKRLIKLTFSAELFEDTVRYCGQYQQHAKDREISYLNILSHASLGRYAKALKLTREHLKTFDPSSEERKLLEHKITIYARSTEAKASPRGVKKADWGKQKEVLSLLDRDRLMLVYDVKTLTGELYILSPGSLKAAPSRPAYLEGLDLNRVIFVSLSSDGREVLASIKTGPQEAEILYRHYRPERKRWSSWKEISEMNPGKWNAYGNFTAGGNYVLFSSDSDSDSGSDIYAVRRNEDGDWSKPFKIRELNTPFNEIALYLHPDGETLYFSSNGMPGNGGYDLYRGRLGESREKVSVTEIENVRDINTFRNEFFPLFVDATGKISFHNYQIADERSVFFYDDRKVRPAAFVDIYVFDSGTKAPLEGVAVTIGKNLKRKTGADGFCGGAVASHKDYRITASLAGYDSASRSLKAGEAGRIARAEIYLKKTTEPSIAAPAPRTFRAAFLGIKALNCPPALAGRSEARLRRGMSGSGKILLSRKELAQAAKKADLPSPCLEGDCLNGYGKALGVRYLVTGSITKTVKKSYDPVGSSGKEKYLLIPKTRESYLIRLQIYDIETGKTLRELKGSSGANTDRALDKLIRELQTLLDTL